MPDRSPVRGERLGTLAGLRHWDQWSEQERAASELVALSEELPSRELRVEARIARAMLALQIADVEGARSHLVVARRSVDALSSKLAHARASVLQLLQALWTGDTEEAMRLNVKAWQACPDDLGQRLVFALPGARRPPRADAGAVGTNDPSARKLSTPKASYPWFRGARSSAALRFRGSAVPQLRKACPIGIVL